MMRDGSLSKCGNQQLRNRWNGEHLSQAHDPFSDSVLTLYCVYRDLFCYRALLWSYEKIFDLPVAFISQYVTQQMRKEANLVTEAHNAERTADYLKKEPTLRKRAMVPTVHWDWTGTSVMTAE